MESSAVYSGFVVFMVGFITILSREKRGMGDYYVKRRIGRKEEAGL